jgi:hypothetical protein
MDIGILQHIGHKYEWGKPFSLFFYLYGRTLQEEEWRKDLHVLQLSLLLSLINVLILTPR